VLAVCAGCLALYDAGVPLKKAVAGVAMGLLLPENLKVLILLALPVQTYEY
jgi:polyribonucleotide nucleotidyltransferase